MTTAAPETPLPPQDAVRDLFGDLLSRPCTIATADEPLPYEPDVQIVIADYIDAEGAVAGMAVADLPLACRAGSALVMMPAPVAEEAISASELDGDMLDCWKEVLNVLSRLLHTPDGPPVTLRGMYRTGQLVPGEVRRMLRGEGSRRRDYVVSVEEYGGGRLTMLFRAAEAA